MSVLKKMNVKNAGVEVLTSRVYCVTLAVVFLAVGVVAIGFAMSNIVALLLVVALIVIGIYFLVAGFVMDDRVVRKLSAFGGSHWLFIPITAFAIFAGNLLWTIIGGGKE